MQPVIMEYGNALGNLSFSLFLNLHVGGILQFHCAVLLGV